MASHKNISVDAYKNWKPEIIHYINHFKLIFVLIPEEIVLWLQSLKINTPIKLPQLSNKLFFFIP